MKRVHSGLPHAWQIPTAEAFGHSWEASSINVGHNVRRMSLNDENHQKRRRRKVVFRPLRHVAHYTRKGDFKKFVDRCENSTENLHEEHSRRPADKIIHLRSKKISDGTLSEAHKRCCQREACKILVMEHIESGRPPESSACGSRTLNDRPASFADQFGPKEGAKNNHKKN